MDSGAKENVFYAVTIMLIMLILVSGILIWVFISTESGKYHHEMRIERVVEVLAGYEDCHVNNVEQRDTYSDTVVLKCKR